MRLKVLLGLCAILLQFGNAYAGDSQFASEELKLLGAEQNAIFTQQVLLVGHSTVIKAASPKSELQHLKK